VTRFAFDSGVRSDQRKKVVVVADLRLGGKPALHHMALGAIRSELAQMNIRMAIVAILANIGEDSVRVALRARQFCMPPSKRELRLIIVVEARVVADGTPAGGSMATFAGNCKRTVRIYFLGGRESREGAEQNYTGESLENDKGNACQRPGRSFEKIAIAPVAFAGWTTSSYAFITWAQPVHEVRKHLYRKGLYHCSDGQNSP